ncbi:MAG TPA: bifunctional DNA primase/polymerase, partial [Candidatus Binatus sp.]|nr:bifunctional DNA primase/polymerase [Candidatus Binatus sp.]
AAARQGWRVFPIVPGTKRPAIKGWPTAASSDPEILAAWWQRMPTANVGLVCGEGFDVIDVDAPDRFHDWLADQRYRLPEGPQVLTGRGGRHFYLAPTGLRTAELRLDGTHIGEHRALGGHAVLAPPSRTSGLYMWLVGPDVALPPAPAWLSGLRYEPARRIVQQRSVALRPTGVRALDALARAVASADEGHRNATLFWAACRAADERHPADLADRVLARAAEAAGLNPREVAATLASARRRAGR